MNRLPCIAAGLIILGSLVVGVSPSSGGTSTPVLDAEAISLPLGLLWKFSSVDVGTELPARNIPTAPVISGDTVYVCARGMTAEKVPTTSVYALSLETGEKLWDHVLEGTVFGTPALADDTLWVSDSQGYLYALDVRNQGRERSRFQLGTSSRCSPVVHDGVVYVGDDGGLVLAVDAKALQEKWRFQARGQVKARVAVSAEHKYVYVSSGEPRLHVLHMATGVEAWNYPMPEVSMESAPVLWDRYLYIASGKRLICITAAQGRYQWDSMRMGTTTGYPIIGTPVLAPDEKGKDARLYFCCEDGTVNAVNARTGRLFWKAPVKLDRIATCAPTVTRDAVLIGAQNGLLYAVSANEGSKLVWKYRAVPPADITAQSKAVSIASPPVVNEGRVLVLVDEGTLLCFSPAAVDAAPPEVKDLKVRDIAIEDQTPVYGMPPLPFTATIVDEGSGIDESKIVFKLDGEVVPHQFLARTGELVYKTPITQPIRPLADGAHTISITVADWMGNILTREWVFRVDHRRIPVPKAQDGPAANPDAINW